MTQTPTSGPEPGWYPDPTDPNGRRYWDGERWTEHTAAASAWGAPTGWQQPAPGAQQYAGSPMPAAPAGAYGAYVPVATPLAPSGMRRVNELFADAGRILKRAWWPIIAVSLLLWLAWAVVVAIVGVALVNVGSLTTAIETSTDALTRYANTQIPADVRQQIADAWEQVPRTQSVAVWVAVAVVVAVLSGLVSCIQIAAINRLAMDAATGQPVSFGTAFRSGFTGGVRLFGYYLLLFVVVFAVTAVWIALVVVTGMAVPALAVFIAILGVVGMILLSLWLVGRLAPITAQAVVARGALGWTWEATRGKFWAVLGRYLLWAIVAGIIAQVVVSIVVFPFSLLASATAASNNTGGMAIAMALLYLLSIAVSMAVSALTYIGVVPIWRDLTTEPEYRSIGENGLPVPRPA